MAGVLTHLQRLKDDCFHVVSSRFTRWTKPLRTSLPLSTLTDLGPSQSELIAEKALLRKPLIILRREVKRPVCTQTDRLLLVLLAPMVRTWKQPLLILQPETFLRGPRELFRLVWKRKAQTASPTPKVAPQTIALMRQMAKEKQLWGAERIGGDLVQLGKHVWKRTIQKDLRTVRTHQPRGQKWSTFLRTHAATIWACDGLSGD